MTRSEIKDRFRQENPEVTDRVVSDTVLDTWCVIGDKEVCAKARLIRTKNEFSSRIDTDEYNLTNEIPSFYDIDDMPGGGVIYDNDPIDLTTIAELDQKRRFWRSASSGTPYDYYRYNDSLFLGRKPSAVKTITVYAILISDDFDDDGKLPFNQRAYLEPFHYSMVLYLTMRAKSKQGKVQEYSTAKAEYEDYLKWMRSEIRRGTHHAIQFRPGYGYKHSQTKRSSRR